MNTEPATSYPGTPIALFPVFADDCLILRPGESMWIDCAYKPVCSGSLPCEISAASNHFSGDLIVRTLPNDTSPLILHPSIIPNGERLRVRLTNPSRQVCVLVKTSCDISSRLGHGIFRNAAVFRTSNPIASVSLIASGRGSEGACAS